MTVEKSDYTPEKKRISPTIQLIILALIGLAVYFGFNYLSRDESEPVVDLTAIELRLELLETGQVPTVVIDGKDVPIWGLVSQDIKKLTAEVNSIKTQLGNPPEIIKE